MRKYSISLLLVTLLSLSSLPAQAAINSGSPCTKLGATSTIKAIKFKCIKSGKKLIWKEVTVLPGVSSSFPEKNTTEPKPTAQLPTVPGSFQELSEHLTGISYAAWSVASKQIRAENVDLGNIHFINGPHTKLNEQDIHYKEAIQAVTNLFAGVPQSKNVYVIYYGRDDIDWAQNQFEKYMDTSYGYGNRSTAAIDNCPQPNCNGGMAVHTKNFDSIILMGDNNGWQVPSMAQQGFMGHTFAHEYTHTIQLANMNPNWGGFPRWLTEGVAEWSALSAISYGSFEDYKRYRANVVLGMQFGDSQTYSESYLIKFLNPSLAFSAGQNIASYLDGYPHWDSYSIGLMVSEILVSMKDQNSLIQILQNINSGQTFGEAFEKEYGISWNEAAPMIAHAISLEIKGKI